MSLGSYVFFFNFLAVGMFDVLTFMVHDMVIYLHSLGEQKINLLHLPWVIRVGADWRWSLAIQIGPLVHDWRRCRHYMLIVMLSIDILRYAGSAIDQERPITSILNILLRFGLYISAPKISRYYRPRLYWVNDYKDDVPNMNCVAYRSLDPHSPLYTWCELAIHASSIRYICMW